MSNGYPDFDNLSHTVMFDGHVLSLNPLSYRLLKVLTEANQEILSANTLISQVWESRAVSNETLKQRVFVLRKSIAEAGIKGLELQSIRGEGYRLIIKSGLKNEQQETSSTEAENGFELWSAHKKLALRAGVFVSLLVAAFLVYNAGPKTTYANNRIAVWTNIKQTEMPGEASVIYANWNQMLADRNADSSIHLILSNRQEDVLVPVQARRSRIALISNFELIYRNDKTFVNLSIVEPRTATILRTDNFELDPDLNAEEVLRSHLDGMLTLISSGKLNLSKRHKENPQDPIWPHLKTLAGKT